ncbi:MAG: hypothetical protein NTX20_00145, partial [Verrucomicrobia bacterium]|nr:hypothetical protein [Verrucomicrobiota bacterium]
MLRLLALVSCLIATLVAADEPTEGKVSAAKKGFGLGERHGQDGHQLDLLKVGWYYNWGSQTKCGSHAQ